MSTLERSKGGLGIGLALVNSFVGLHGGAVEAFSEGVGQGSEFVVSLPLHQHSAIEDSVKAEPASAPVATRQRILLVDDNLDILESLREYLVQQNHVVSATSDPLRALEIAAEFAPEVAILDIGLPVMSGYELAAKLRQLYPRQELRLVALTGYGQLKDRAESRAAGFDEHLVKPISFLKLDAAIIE